MTRLRITLAWLAAASGCGGAPPEPAPPPAPMPRAPIAAPAASAPAPVVPVASVAPPSAPSAGPGSPDELPPNLPTCARRPARAPVGFASASTKSGLVFTTIDAATAPSLQRVQRLVDGFAQHGSCYVSRTDGELLVVFCSSFYLNGSGNPRAGPSESFVFHRVGSEWGRIGIRAALPGTSDPRRAFGRGCHGFAHDFFADIPLEEPSDHAPWLSGVEVWPRVLHLESGKRGEPGGSAECNVLWSDLGAELGCGPLAHVLRPELLDDAALAGAPIAPLAVVNTTGEIDSQEPSFASRDPRTQGVARALQTWIDALRGGMERAGMDALGCEVMLSNADMASVLCPTPPGVIPTTIDGAPIPIARTHRLADGAQITTADLVAAHPDVLDRVAKKCVGGMLGKPRRELEPYLPGLPTLKAADVTFGFGQNDAAFVVHYPLYVHPKTAPEGMTETSCNLTYGELGFSWRDLLRRNR